MAAHIESPALPGVCSQCGRDYVPEADCPDRPNEPVGLDEPLAFDPGAAGRLVHFTDHRVRELAEARWRMDTGRSHRDWLVDGPRDRGNPFVRDARDWLRAAVSIGMLAPIETDGRVKAQQANRPAGSAEAERVIRAVIKPSLPDTSEVTANEITRALSTAGYVIVPDAERIRLGLVPGDMCTFCGQRPDRTRVVVTGPGVNICNWCIELCRTVAEEAAKGSAPRPPTHADDDDQEFSGCPECGLPLDECGCAGQPTYPR